MKSVNYKHSKVKILILGIAILILFGLIYVIYIVLNPLGSKNYEIVKSELGECFGGYLDKNYKLQNYQSEILSIDCSRSMSATKPAIIFYPGGLVTPEGYLENMKLIAKEYPVSIYIVRFPLNLAFTDLNVVEKIITNNPGLNNKFFIAGHSLGGAMACQYISTKSQNELNDLKISGLILEGAYCDSNISKLKLSVLTLIGENDGLSTIDKVKQYDINLPTNFIRIILSDHNHAQFGNYGNQSHDNLPKISNEIARQNAKNAIIKFMKELN